jgi:hypothetical protein
MRVTVMEYKTERDGEIARERTLFLYSTALERGDFARVAEIWEQASRDDVLEQLLLDIDAELRSSTFDLQLEYTSDAAVVRELVHRFFPGALGPTEEELTVVPVTVAEVAARLQTDLRTQSDVDRDVVAIKQLREMDVPLADNLSQEAIHKFFEAIGLTVSERIEKLFRQAAIFMSMGRRQGELRMAATRQQQTYRRTTIKSETTLGEDEYHEESKVEYDAPNA